MRSEVLFSTIKSDIKNRLLMRAILFGISGICFLLGMGTFAPLRILHTWGIPTFALGMFLIAWGMIPYRKLSALETQPLRIELFENYFSVITSEKLCETFAYDAIHSIEYIEANNRYGIMALFKNDTSVFLPYFTKGSFQILSSCLD